MVFTGLATHDPARDSPSRRWRLEFGDDAGTVVAIALPNPACVQGPGGLDTEVLDTAVLVLPVRRDHLELAVLTGLALVVDRLHDAPGQLLVEVSIELAPHTELSAGLTGSAMTVVDSPRHPDRPDEQPRPAAGVRILQIQDVAPASTRHRLDRLRELSSCIDVARALALAVLDHFGVEDTLVLQCASLQPRGAWVGRQQQLHQYASAAGRPWTTSGQRLAASWPRICGGRPRNRSSLHRDRTRAARQRPPTTR